MNIPPLNKNIHFYYYNNLGGGENDLSKQIGIELKWLKFFF